MKFLVFDCFLEEKKIYYHNHHHNYYYKDKFNIIERTDDPSIKLRLNKYISKQLKTGLIH